MSKFNTVSSAPARNKTVNKAGGNAFKESPELELVTLLLCSLMKDTYYTSANEQLKNLQRLCAEIDDKKFLAQAAIYARTKFGMRSITHALAGELSKYLVNKDGKGFAWSRNFYNKVIYRPDDILEILSYVSQGVKLTAKQHPVRHMKAAMRKGFKLALGRFDEYSLSKYRGEGKEIKLIDVVNLIHPLKTNANVEVIAKLVKGELKSKDTWEAKLTKAGQAAKAEAKTEEQKEELAAEFKKEAWVDLIKNKKIKYFALLRNLRNIYQQAPDVLDEALLMLVERDLIKKSLILPFQFNIAVQEIKSVSGTRKIVSALNKAIDISLDNVPKFDGETLVVLDKSGSMAGRPMEIGALFSAVLYKVNNADYMEFADVAKLRTLDSDSTLTSIAESIESRGDVGGGTNFTVIFPSLKKAYDRIIILSDMQGWMDGGEPTKQLAQYRTKFNCDPKVYSFNLSVDGGLMFPERNVFAIAGFSEKVFDFMAKIEKDRNAMVNEIKKVEI